MRARLRVIPAAVALATGLAAPALAQDAGGSTAGQPVSIAPSPPTGEAVGPAQLKDFSLQGTVTRRADPPAQPQTPAARDAAAGSAPVQSQAGTAPIAERSSRTVERVTPTPPPARAESAPASSTGLPTPDQTLSFSPATLAPEPIAGSAPAPIESPAADVSSGFVSHWPWLIALLAALGAAVWYFRRQRSSGYAYAGSGGEVSSFDFRPAQPAQAPRATPRPPEPRAVASPAPEPLRVPEERGLSGAVVSTRLKAAPEAKREVAPAPPSLGIVSTRLRPWLDIEFVPLEATFSDQHGIIQFDVTLFNSGSAPAREILLEARLFNAGDDQDEAIERYFANPTLTDNHIDVIQPLKRMTFRTSATVPREQMRIFEAGGRKVWVPLIGFNSTYRWSGGEGQTSASYLLGRNTNGEKMAPFRVDLGARKFNDLGAHEHKVRLRR